MLKNVVTADTTLEQVGLVAAVSVAWLRLSLTIACSTIENNVSTVDLWEAHPSPLTVIVKSLVCVYPCHPITLTVSLEIICCVILLASSNTARASNSSPSTWGVPTK